MTASPAPADLDNQPAIRAPGFFSTGLADADPEVFAAIQGELKRQQDKIELIASENIVSKAVLEATGSVFTNKYAEGYPGKRYYGGCEWADVVENLAIATPSWASISQRVATSPMGRRSTCPASGSIASPTACARKISCSIWMR